MRYRVIDNRGTVVFEDNELVNARGYAVRAANNSGEMHRVVETVCVFRPAEKLRNEEACA